MKQHVNDELAHKHTHRHTRLNKVHSVSWNIEGKKLATASIDQTARIYTIDNKSTTLNPRDSIELKGHQGDVDQLAWDPSHSDKLCTVSVDKTVKFWDVRTPKNATCSLDTQGENINICWGPDGKTLAIGNRDDVVTIVDVRGGGNKKPFILKTIPFDVEVPLFH